MRSLLVIIVLMLTAPVFALEPALDLQDSLAADSLRVDSLSKISLALDVDTNGVVDTNKVERTNMLADRNRKIAMTINNDQKELKSETIIP